MTTSPATSEPEQDPVNQAISILVGAFRHLNLSTGPHLQEGAADTLVRLWLERGRNLRDLPDRLKHETVPRERVSDWHREIDNLLADDTRRPLERDRLQHAVGELVRQLNRQANDPGIYRKLVELGYECGRVLHEFQGCLRREKLDKTRISEIMRIVRSRETARQFITGNLSVRRALLLARTTPRKPGRRPKTEPSTAEAKAEAAEQAWSVRLLTTMKALEELIRAIPKKTPAYWQIQAGMYQLSFKPETYRS